MATLTLAQLERHLFTASDMLRGTMDLAECRDLIVALLFLKRVNDQFDGARGPDADRGVFAVPPEATWQRVASAEDDVVVDRLRQAFAALESHQDNRVLRGLFDDIGWHRFGRGSWAGERVAALVGYFGSLRLCDEDLESPDVIGAAHEYLIRAIADSAGLQGGEFYTPRAVVRMMVELARPHEGMRVYDPCVGSGGMLVHAIEYVDEHGGDSRGLGLAGQDANAGSWRLAMMNLLFHGARNFSLRTGDSLTDPRHPEGGFDLVLSNPPFSMDYSKDAVPRLKQRMPYGATPERGKADLMFLQHMLDMVKQRGGSVVTVMPHGVLFRGGAEKEIREELLKADVIEAVIGLAPNLFYGTGTPACVVVLRAPGRKTAERRGKVLIVNADREFHRERAQNVLLPAHVGKIVSVFHAFEDVEGFAKVVSADEVRANDSSLGIGRYVDSSPPPEFQDIRAYVEGGVPLAEIETSRPLLDAYGLTVEDLFAVRPGDAAYVDFRPEDEQAVRERLTELTRGAEQRLWTAFDEWWQTASAEVAALAPAGEDDGAGLDAGTGLARLRGILTVSLVEHLLTVGLLDRHALAGETEGWWHETKHELKALSTVGFHGVVDGWVDTVETLFGPVEDPVSSGRAAHRSSVRSQAFEHKVVKSLVPDFLEERASVGGRLAELTQKVKKAEAALAGAQEAAEADREEAGSGTTDVAEPLEVTAARDRLRAIRRQRAEARRTLEALETGFLSRLAQARRELMATAGERHLVGEILRAGLAGRLQQLLVARRGELIRTYGRWQEKYRLSFREIEKQLYGTSQGAAQNNPWSQRRAWNLTAQSARTVSGRREMAAVVHELIDAEKVVEAALAKLEFDELVEPLALLAPGALDEDGVKSVPLRDLLVSARSGSAGGPADGDVLLSAVRTDEGFAVDLWQGSPDRGAPSSHAIRLRSRTNLLSPQYLAAWLRLPHVQDRLVDVARTGTTDRVVLSPGRLLDVEVELPSRAAQRDFEQRYLPLHEQKLVRRRQLAKLRLIRGVVTDALTR